MNLEEISEFKELKSIDFIAKQVVEGFISGLHKSPYHGFSVEFAEHRIYNSGESTRHIDWKLFGKTDRLYVKKYEEETNLRSYILLDTSSSMLFPYKKNFNKLLFSIYSTAALINLLSRQRDAVGLVFFDKDIQLSTDVKQNSSHKRLLYNHLQNLIDRQVPENRKTSVADTLHKIAEMIHKRSLVIIFSDMFEYEKKDEIFNALMHLKHNKHEVIIYHVFDKKLEKDFDFENRPYRFIDLETGKSLKINPNKVRENYVQKINSFFNEIKLKAGSFGIDYVEADINSDFKYVLTEYLLKREKLY